MDKIREEQGLPPASRPGAVEPYRDLQWVWAGFWRLSNSRPQGMGGPSRISMMDIYAYTKLQRFDLSKTQDFLYFVENLDTKFMEWAMEEQEKFKNSKPGK